MVERTATFLLAKAAKCRRLALGQDTRTTDALLRLAEEHEVEATAWTRQNSPA